MNNYDDVVNIMRSNLDGYCGKKVNKKTITDMKKCLLNNLNDLVETKSIQSYKIDGVYNSHDKKNKIGKVMDFILWKLSFVRKAINKIPWLYTQLYYTRSNKPFELRDILSEDQIDHILQYQYNDSDSIINIVEQFIKYNYVRKLQHKENPYTDLHADFSIMPVRPLEYILVTTRFEPKKETENEV